jgi:hypothetical protein
MANMSSILYVIGVNMSNAYTQSLSITFTVDYFVSTGICVLGAAIQNVMGNEIHNMFEVQKLDTELYQVCYKNVYFSYFFY